MGKLLPISIKYYAMRILRFGFGGLFYRYQMEQKRQIEGNKVEGENY